jgi:2-polyprenyl-3-methyl-5-hydroxy-6-metoxy-1,4-benzoquinol methylase
MAPDSIAMKLVSRPARVASFVLAGVLAAVVLMAVTVLWLLLFLLFLPLWLATELLGWPRRPPQPAEEDHLSAGASVSGLSRGQTEATLVFDRRRDVSKLFGCNTRNVRYRWEVFSERLEQVRNRPYPRALDFGAGSLRDSYEMSRQGFEVVSMDLDPVIIKRYFDSYDWTGVTSTPEIFTGSISGLGDAVGPGYFDLAISFDVIEHLERPDEYLQGVRPLLKDDGYLFAIVPNRRSLFERYFKYSLKKYRQRGLSWTRGVPHLQFKSPEEWDKFLEANGFEIIEHDMTIGPLVNDLWHGMLGLPIRVWVAPVLHRWASLLRLRFNPGKFEESFSPAWLMATVNVWDEVLKPQTRNWFGWNLIVACRKSCKVGCD